tara:strand:+ start:545 stop:739 length:195 start_codon:yes stop_codon:yes gene_type:complete
MFEGCTIKYSKDTMTDENSCVMITYPADENGIKKLKSVPINEENTDYQNILKWVEDGNTIEEAD